MNQPTIAQHRSAELEKCIQNCEDCHHVCIETVSHCLELGGVHASPDHIRLLHDCIQICHTTEDFMLRGSPLHSFTCWVCAEVCTRCADDCERIGGNDAQMRACAEICRQCADSCSQMAEHSRHLTDYTRPNLVNTAVNP